MSVDWFSTHVPRPNAAVRLFCFSNAGVGASAYRLWPAALSSAFEICPIQLPGRENRLRESPIDRIDEMVRRLLPALIARLDRSFAFFGHSMGALLAFETARALHQQTGLAPGHLFVSGRRPPHVPDPHPPIHQLADAEFVAEINRRYGGIPQEVLEQRELMELLLPCLRADIAALESYPIGSPSPLPCGLSAYGGIGDRMTPRAHLEAWRCLTNTDFMVRLYPGDHFYLRAQQQALLDDISAQLLPLARQPAPRRALA